MAFSKVQHCCFSPHKKLQSVLRTLIYLWAFPIVGFFVKCCSELTFASRKKEPAGDALISLSVIDRDLASRMDCSSLGPRMLTLNFMHWILQVTYACWIWGRWKYLSWIFLMLNIWFWIFVKMRWNELYSEAKKSRGVISMHKYSVPRIQWLFIFWNPMARIYFHSLADETATVLANK